MCDPASSPHLSSSTLWNKDQDTNRTCVRPQEKQTFSSPASTDHLPQGLCVLFPDFTGIKSLAVSRIPAQVSPGLEANTDLPSKANNSESVISSLFRGRCHTRNPPWSAQISGYSNEQSWAGFIRQGRAWGCPALPARLTRESEKN